MVLYAVSDVFVKELSFEECLVMASGMIDWQKSCLLSISLLGFNHCKVLELSFSCEKFLNTTVCYRKYCRLWGHGPQPP